MPPWASEGPRICIEAAFLSCPSGSIGLSRLQFWRALHPGAMITLEQVPVSDPAWSVRGLHSLQIKVNPELPQPPELIQRPAQRACSFPRLPGDQINHPPPNRTRNPQESLNIMQSWDHSVFGLHLQLLCLDTPSNHLGISKPKGL